MSISMRAAAASLVTFTVACLNCVFPGALAAQDYCPTLASLAMTADKSAYVVGEPIIGEVVFVNNMIFPAPVDFTVAVSKDGQNVLTRSYTVQTSVGRNAWSILDAFGTNTLPSPGVYALSVSASYMPVAYSYPPPPPCSLTTTLTLTGLAATGVITVNSTPAGAAIWYAYNGGALTDSGQVTPHMTGSAPAGTYQIVLRKAGYVEWTQTQTLPPGGSISFNATLTPLTGTVAVNSTPAGAAIWYSNGTGPLIDSGQLTPFTNGTATAGTYQIVLRKAGYVEWTQTQTLPPGGAITFAATLTPLTGAVAVNSTPAGAAIWYSFNGGALTDSGQVTPFTFSGVPAGAYNIVLRKAGYAEWTQTQTLPPGGAITFDATLTPLTLPPVIAELSPSSGPVNTPVTINGSNFSARDNRIQFGPVTLQATASLDGKTLQFTVPRGEIASQPVTPGPYTITVTNSFGMTSNPVTFLVLPRRIEVDAAQVGRDISRVKKGHGDNRWSPLYGGRKYAREIGYEQSLVRIHDAWLFLGNEREHAADHIERLSKLGNADIMLDILGMPKEFSSAPDDTYNPYPLGCMPRWANVPPRDYVAWKNYIRDWVRYLNVDRKLGIKYFEIWNEPDGGQLVGGKIYGCFWSGTEQEYLQFYKATVEGIREAYAPNPVPAEVKIGGPAVAQVGGKVYGGTDPLYVSLPRFASQNGLPLDFYSWHDYSLGPKSSTIGKVAVSSITASLGLYGFGNAELILDEYGWTEAIFEPGIFPSRSVARSVLVASQLAMSINSGIDRQGMHTFADPGAVAFGLFGWQTTNNLITKPEYNLFKAISEMGDLKLASWPEPGKSHVGTLASKNPGKVSLLLYNHVDTEQSELQAYRQAINYLLNKGWSQQDIDNYVLRLLRGEIRLEDLPLQIQQDLREAKAVYDQVLLQLAPPRRETVTVQLRNLPPNLTHYTRYIIDATHSNAYAVETLITTKLSEAQTQAQTLAKERFINFLKLKGYTQTEIDTALIYVVKYLANPDDPEVKNFLNSLNPTQRQDLINAFSSAWSLYNSTIELAAEEISRWPQVKLHSETKPASLTGSEFSESLTLEPYSVHLLVLSDREIVDITPPSINIASPVNGSTATGPVAILAQTSDNFGVRMVEFYVDGVMLGFDTTAPHEFVWETSGTYSGTHTIMAKAYDASGNSANHVVTVTIPLTTGVNPAIIVDFLQSGRDITRLKKGYGVGEPEPYTTRLYGREIGYAGGFVRLHDAYSMPHRSFKRIVDQIENVLKNGKPEFLFNVTGMPRDLSTYGAYEANDPGCLPAWATAPPKDYAAWKNYVRDWVRFLNIERGYGIKYFEIWNEPTPARPDARVGGGLLGCHWSGTEAEYHQLYKATVEGIREAYAPNPVPASVKIGGPATISWKDQWSSYQSPNPSPLFESLPRFAQQNGLPLDFYSWHQYSGKPGEIGEDRVAQRIRGSLQSFGFGQAELILDEYELWWWPDRRAALLAGTFASLTNNGLDRQSMHAFEDVMPSYWYGLFGGPLNLIAKPEFNLFKAISVMGDTAIAVSSQAVSHSLYMLGSKSSDRVGLMLVNFSASPVSGLGVRFKNPSPSFAYYTRFLIDATHSNPYTVGPRILDRINLAQTQAGAAAKDRFTLFLRQRGYVDFEINTAILYIAKYLANPDDPEVKSFLNSLSPKQRQDLIDAFNAAMALHTTLVRQTADEINHWPEVRLYAESSLVSPSGGEYVQTINMEPASVQFLFLSDRPIVDQTFPQVAIASPAQGATVSGAVKVTANASDNVDVTMIEFYVDGALAASATSAPYEFVWYTTGTHAGSHTLESRAYDAAGNAARHSISVTVPEGLRSTQVVVGPSGGTVGDMQATGAQVSILPGTISSSQTVSVSTIATSAVQDSQAVSLGLSPAGLPMDIHIVGQESGSQFPQLVTITLSYDATQVSNPNLLTVQWWDEPAGTWRPVPQVQVDPSAHTVTARVNHFTLFRVFEVVPKAAFSGNLGEVFAFPNPATSGKVTIHVEAGQADQVEIRIYDAAGALVHRAAISGPPGIGVNGREAFEYAWNASGAASGIYLYAVRAVKGDQSATTVRKLAVVR